MKIIVTGSEGLLGRQISHSLCKLNYKVTNFDLKLGHDLSNESQVINLFSSHKADVLINCFVINDHISSTRKKKSFMNYSLDDFEKSLNINVVSLFSVCRQFIKNNKKGKIINFSSIYAYRSPRPSFYKNGDKDPAYGPSKAAVSNLTKYLSVHADHFNINCIVPGGVENSQDESFKKKYSKELPLGRLMKSKEIIGIVKFLLSDESSYCTGSEFFVDGGWNAR